MTQLSRPLLLLVTMLLAVLVYSALASLLLAPLGLTAELDYYVANKWLLALLLVSMVLVLGVRQETGLIARVNWRTLPLYWPMALIAGLIWLGDTNPPGAEAFIKIVLFCTAVGISEELMFRGLVFHWFREIPVRGIVLISAAAFGSVHLVGLASDIHPAVILSQAYFAFALGIIFACARARDVSIVLPILVHTVFDIAAVSAKGSVSQTFENVPEMVTGMMFTGTIALCWGLFLLWKLGKTEGQVDARHHPKTDSSLMPTPTTGDL